MRTKLALRLFCLVSLVVGPMFFASTASCAQVRGVYPVGMNATNSGVTPETGITYSNLFVFFSRDEKRDSEGNVVATGRNSIMMDLKAADSGVEEEAYRYSGNLWILSTHGEVRGRR